MTHGKNRLLFGVPSRHSSLISTAEFRLKSLDLSAEDLFPSKKRGLRGVSAPSLITHPLIPSF